MYISLNWIKEYIPNLKLDSKELADLITMHIVEVEGVGTGSKLGKDIVVGEIKEIQKHPNADKLQLCIVDTGEHGTRKIVCGAPNIKEGMKAPVALPGCELPNGMKIKETEVRGVKSTGMMCAEDELGLGSDHTGILELPSDSELGREASEYIVKGGSDAVFEIENKSLTNRPDLFGHIGMAREIAAVTGEDFKLPEEKMPETQNASANLTVKVEGEGTRRYDGVVLDVKVGPSPDWLKQKIEAVGLRPVNNVVDITNYILFDVGAPMHAFDVAKLAKDGEDLTIIAREAKAGETVRAIDDKDYKLEEGDLVIADAQKPVAIAGIMGGKESEVTESTTRIVLEAAMFDGTKIGNTSRRLGLISDSSTRFSKSPDPSIVNYALAKAIRLLSELADAKIVSAVAEHYPKPSQEKQIEIDIKDANKFIGTEITEEKIGSILTALGFSIAGDDGKLKVTVPTFRTDVSIVEDVYEEIARIYGYENIERKPVIGELRPPAENLDLYWERTAKILLEGLGYHEIYTYSFTSKEMTEKLNMDVKGHLRVKNSNSPENEYMNASLIPDILTAAKKNLRYFDAFQIFELDRTFYGVDGNAETKYGHEQKEEERMLTGVIVDPSLKGDALFKRVKGAVEILAKKFGIPAGNLEFKSADIPHQTFHPGRTALVSAFGKNLGYVGEIHPQVLDAFGIDRRVGFFDLNFEEWVVEGNVLKDYSVISDHPAVERDLSFIVSEDVKSGDISWAIQEVVGDLAMDIQHFDTFSGEGIPSGKKSLAFRIVYQAADRTLKEDEVDSIHSKVVEMVKDKFGGEIRN